MQNEWRKGLVMQAILEVCKDIVRFFVGVGLVVIVFIVLAPSLLTKKVTFKATRF